LLYTNSFAFPKTCLLEKLKPRLALQIIVLIIITKLASDTLNCCYAKYGSQTPSISITWKTHLRPRLVNYSLSGLIPHLMNPNLYFIKIPTRFLHTALRQPNQSFEFIPLAKKIIRKKKKAVPENPKIIFMFLYI
jgi:hypothetical protein